MTQVGMISDRGTTITSNSSQPYHNPPLTHPSYIFGIFNRFGICEFFFIIPCAFSFLNNQFSPSLFTRSPSQIFPISFSVHAESRGCSVCTACVYVCFFPFCMLTVCVGTSTPVNSCRVHVSLTYICIICSGMLCLRVCFVCVKFMYFCTGTFLVISVLMMHTRLTMTR